MPGTTSSTSPGPSCPSACAIGHTGSNQRDLVLALIGILDGDQETDRTDIVGSVAHHGQFTPMRMERVPLYPVEITFDEYTEDALTARMTAMREWLDHYRFEPTIFRHTFTKLASCFRCISTSKQNTTTRRDSPISGPRLSIATATWRSATHQYLPT